MSYPRLQIKVLGHQAVSRKLRRGAAAAVNMRPALWEIREDMFRVIRATFTSQGRRYGGSWKALDPKYVERKLNRGLDPRILIARSKLMDSMTRRGDRNMRSHVTRADITLDTTLPYADTHQYGDEDRGIAARPYVRFYPQDRSRWVKILEDHLMGAMRG